MTVAVFIQARMGATRLPGKPLFKVMGKTLLSYLIERLKRCNLVDQIIVLTTENPRDRQLAKEAEKEGVPVFFGSEDNVLERFYFAAQLYRPTTIVRITADCPLMDPLLVDELIRLYQDAGCDYLSNTLQRSYPRGMDIEVFSRTSLEEAYRLAKLPYECEHVTPFLYQHPEQFRLLQAAQKEDMSPWRWTVDTPEDFTLIAKLIASLYPQKPDFTLQDLAACYRSHPEWHSINAHIIQKQLPAETHDR